MSMSVALCVLSDYEEGRKLGCWSLAWRLCKHLNLEWRRINFKSQSRVFYKRRNGEHFYSMTLDKYSTQWNKLIRPHNDACVLWYGGVLHYNCYCHKTRRKEEEKRGKFRENNVIFLIEAFPYSCLSHRKRTLARVY